MSDEDFVLKMKDHIAISMETVHKDNILNLMVRKILKFEIKKFSIYYSVSKTREKKGERIILENEIKAFKEDLEENKCKQEYLDCKRKLNDIFDQNGERIKMRSKCKCYEEGEQNSKFLLNIEKNRAMQSKVQLPEITGKEIKDQERIMEKLYQFYENLFSKDVTVSNKTISSCLKDVNLPESSMEQRELCEDELTKKGVKDVLNKMENNKTPGNDGFTKEYFESFWLEIKSLLLLSFKKGFLTEELSTSQKQTVIKFLEKKDR